MLENILLPKLNSSLNDFAVFQDNIDNQEK